MGLRRFLIHHDVVGLRYAVRIFIGTTAVWLLLRSVGDAEAVWAVISVIVVTEPQMQTAWLTLGSRIVNTVIGCTIGLDVLASGRSGDLDVAAGSDGNRPRLHLRSPVVAELAAGARHRSPRHRFRRSGTIENKWSGGRPPSCGGSSVGLRHGLSGNLVHVEDLGAAGCSKGRRTLIEGGGGHC